MLCDRTLSILNSTLFDFSTDSRALSSPCSAPIVASLSPTARASSSNRRFVPSISFRLFSACTSAFFLIQSNSLCMLFTRSSAAIRCDSSLHFSASSEAHLDTTCETPLCSCTEKYSSSVIMPVLTVAGVSNDAIMGMWCASADAEAAMNC